MPDQIVVVAGHAERTVVAELDHEHRALGGDRPARQPEVHEVHQLEVGGRGRVYVGPIVLEVQDVRQGEAAADGRHAVALDPQRERVGMGLHDRPRVRRPAPVEVEDQVGGRRPVRVDGHDRRVLAAHAEGDDVRGRTGRSHRHRPDAFDDRLPERAGVLLGDVPRPS